MLIVNLLDLMHPGFSMGRNAWAIRAKVQYFRYNNLNERALYLTACSGLLKGDGRWNNDPKTPGKHPYKKP
jgi:hypothetical protein